MASQLADSIELGEVVVPLITAKPSGVVAVSQLQATSERSIDDILKQETLVSSFTITSDVEVGTRLDAFTVSPNRFHPPGASSRISFMAALFQFWRGTIMLRLVFTKTILQQMKIAVLFVPGAKIDDPTPTKIEIMQYSHKLIINPSNEMEVMFEIPFISDRPFLRMSEDTGVLYFILFQPFTASVDPNNVISCDVFVSSRTLQFHEFGIIPSLDPLGFTLPNDLMFLLSETSANPVSAAGNTDAVSITTDSGAVANSYGFDVTEDISWCTVGAALSAMEYSTPEVYDPATCLTIFGEPETGYAGMGRVVYIKMANQKCVSTTFHFSNRGVFFRLSGSAVTQQFFGPMSELSRDFSQYITYLPNLTSRLVELERMVAHLMGVPVDLDQRVQLSSVSNLRSVFENRMGTVVDYQDIKHVDDDRCPLCASLCGYDELCPACSNVRSGDRVIHVCQNCDNTMACRFQSCPLCGGLPLRMYEKIWLVGKEVRNYIPVIVEHLPTSKPLFLQPQHMKAYCPCPSGYCPGHQTYHHPDECWPEPEPEPEPDLESETESEYDQRECFSCGSFEACSDSCECNACLDYPIDTNGERVAEYISQMLEVPKPGTVAMALGILVSAVREIYSSMIYCGYIVFRDTAIGEEPNLFVCGGWRRYRHLRETSSGFAIPLPHHFA